MARYSGIEIEGINPFGDEEDDYDPFQEEENRWFESRAFDFVPKHGFHAHAYKKQLNNLKMIRLREKGKSYREIAKQLNCSPSTVRNRLKKMGIE